MSLICQFAIRNKLLYSGFVLLNVQIFFEQKISFATFGVSIDDVFTRYAGLGYSLFISNSTKFSVVIEMHWATVFHANHSLDGAMDACWSDHAKYVLQKRSLFSNGDYCVQNLRYKFKMGFKHILKG